MIFASQIPMMSIAVAVLACSTAGCELGPESANGELSPDAAIGSTGQPISGGSLTTTAPWIIGIDLPGGYFCSGSVLSEHWVLTAAHCVAGKGSSGSVTIVYASSPSAATPVYSGTASFYKHPSYQPFWFLPDWDNDVALIRLNSGTGINTAITGRAALWGYSKPWASYWSSQRDFSVIGWGLTDPSGGNGCVSGARKKRLGSGFRIDRTDTTAKMVKAPQNRVHTCSGDSGTPWSFVRAGFHIAFAVHSGYVPNFVIAGNYQAATLLSPKYGWLHDATKATGLMLDCATAGYAGGVPYLQCNERTYNPTPPPTVPGSSCPTGKYCCDPSPFGGACSICMPYGTSCP